MKNKKIIGIIIAIVAVIAVFAGGMALSENLVLREDVTTTVENGAQVVPDGGQGDGTVDASDDASAQNPGNNIQNGSEETTKKSDAAGVPEAPSAPNTAGKFVLKLSDIPQFSGKPYYTLNNNNPSFPGGNGGRKYYEEYAPLDNLGRCGVAEACLGKETMPTEERGEIGQVKPSGWKTVKYDCVDGKYLYNRCHLIGFQLSGENANERNLITGTRYMNVDGMLPFENMIADYIKETGNHVLYRVTPIYNGNELVARGVQVEAFSVEDNGDGICFNVYCYNNQPGVRINYANGESQEVNDGINPSIGKPVGNGNNSSDNSDFTSNTKGGTYLLNTNTKKIHEPGCSATKNMKESNKESYSGSIEDLLERGYSKCKVCNP